jgi:hypothetical protein
MIIIKGVNTITDIHTNYLSRVLIEKQKKISSN